MHRSRRRSKRSNGTVNKGGGYVTHEKPRSAPATPAPAPAPAPAAPAPAAEGALRPVPSSGSLLSVSAGASTILANSNSSLDLRTDSLPGAGHHHNGTSSGRQSQRLPRSKVAPAADGGVALMSDHLQGRAEGRSGVAWPSATIPARVKKLSWDTDTDTDTRHKDSGGVDVITDATNPTVAEHMNLTVYF